MGNIQWIKITTDIFDDEKVLLIENLPDADTIIVVWFKLLTLAGKQNYGGVLMMNDRIHYTEEMLATLFRRPLNTVRMALKTFEQFGMIEIINDVVTIPNWEKHQSVDKMDKVKEQQRIRTARHREKQKQLASQNAKMVSDGSDDSVTCNVTCNGEERYSNAIEKEIDIDIDNNSNSNMSKKSVFELFEAEYGRLLSSTQSETVRFLIDENNPDLVKEALRLSVLRGKTCKGKLNLSYIEGILRNWQLNGVSLVEHIPKSKPKAFQSYSKQPQKSNVPDWSNPNYKGLSNADILAELEGVSDDGTDAF